MAETETLEQRVAELESQLAALTATTPTEYYTHQYSGEEIDAAVGRAVSGGALDTSVENVSKELGTFVRPNLLDNWYFGNPVNQRGQTGYTGVTYSIDRWYNQGDNFALGDGCVQIDSLGPAHVWLQRIPSDLHQAIAGQTVTFSVLAEGDFSDWRITDTSGFAVTHKDTPFTGNLVSWTFVVSEYAQIGGLGVYCNAAGKTIRIIAAKLELGDTQTLAHQDSAGNWVLNEVPDYGEQLRRCQRYFRRILPGQYAGFARGCAYNANSARIIIPFETMRTSPPIDLNNASGLFASNGATGDVYSLSFSVAWTTPESITFDIAKTGAFVDGKEYYLHGDGTSYIDIIADL